jgi:branched-chain amino acid transport system permease protein
VEIYFDQIDTVLIFAIYAVSLNLLLGYTGQFSVAHAAFGGIGGYTAGYLTSLQGWGWVPALVLGIIVAGIVGALTALPALYFDVRYLILLTLTLSTATIAVISAIPVLGGAYGLGTETSPIPFPKLFGHVFDKPSQFFIPMVVLAALIFAICWRIAYSPYGRVLRGIRDDELATRGVGKNVVAYKVTIFGVTAAMAGSAGAMYGFYNNTLQPSLFNLAQSLLIIAMVVVGGTANLLGSLLGATLLTLLEPFLNDHIHTQPERVGYIRYMIYGGLIVGFMLLRPQGLLPEYLTLRSLYVRIRSLPETLKDLPRLIRERRVQILIPATAAGVFADPTLAAETDAEFHDEGAAPVDGAAAATSHVSVAAPEPRQDGRAATNGGGIVLEATDLKKYFGGIRAADELDIKLELGRVTGLIGPNGAGKTTVFNLLTGVIPLDEGTVKLNGTDITGWTFNRIAKAGMARSYQDVRVYPRMSVLDNVRIAVPNQPGERLANAFLRPLKTQRGEAEVHEKAMEALRFVGLDGSARRIAGALAFGEQKLVALARLMATEAEVLLLDEPASGVDVDWIERMLALIAQLRDRGKSVCVVEHNLHVVERVANWVYFMENGRITAEGTMRDLMGQERLAEVYFGSG